MTERAKELAEKLLALARRGVGGERENAESALLRHLEKHGLTLADFEEQNEIYPIKIPWLSNNQQGRNGFYMQIIASVIGKKRCSNFDLVDENHGRQSIVYSGSIAEKIEIEAKVDVFWSDYQQQTELFRAAYIQKNRLFALPDPDAEDDDDDEPLTPEERARNWRMAQMMEGIERKTVHKQIG